MQDFNPPTPCGVGRIIALIYQVAKKFQSTHPVRGGTRASFKRQAKKSRFQSTHPVRGGTAGYVRSPLPLAYFNPPTPCGVGLRYREDVIRCAYFNPPTPCGVGHIAHAGTAFGTGFQSTHPVRGGTPALALNVRQRKISIHPPRAWWDD